MQLILFFEFRFTIIPLERSFIRLWYDLASNFASSRVKLDPSPLEHLRDVFFKGPLFGFWPLMVPNPLRPVLSMPHLQEWLVFQVKESLHSLSLHHALFLRQNFWLPLMVLVCIGQFLIISISLGIIWEFFFVSREVDLVIYLLTKF